MAQDIGQDLLLKVQQAFKSDFKANKKIYRVYDRIKSNEATYQDAYTFAKESGNIRAKAFKNIIRSSVLPDGKMYYNIAETILTDTLNHDFSLISDTSVKVQEFLNQRIGLNINAIPAKFNQDKLKGFIERLSNEDNYDEVAWILDEPIRVNSLSVVDDTIKVNADFQSESGIETTVIRYDAGNCCEWCQNLAGSYTYPNVPEDVFKRHDNCRCTIEYKGRKVNNFRKR